MQGDAYYLKQIKYIASYDDWPLEAQSPTDEMETMNVFRKMF